MLDKQVNMYSVDTGHFYSNNEKYLHEMNCKYRKERNYLKNQLPTIEKKLLAFGLTHNDVSMFKSKAGNKTPYEVIRWNYVSDNEIMDSKIHGKLLFMQISENDTDYCAQKKEYCDLVREYIRINTLIIHKRKKAYESKAKLLALIGNRMAQNEKTDGKDHIRVLRENELNDTNVISVFESSLTRAIDIKTNGGDSKALVTDALLVVQVYYFDVFKDISFYGFMFHDEKYKYYTSSAGQIRKKKAVFIKESVWNRVEKTIMCGLTIDKINAKGGNNVNKHLAYMALSNSATDVWEDFDIDRCIVVDDFESDVYGTYDFINDKDYTITRMNGSIPIPHTDGVGMMLPCVMTKNTMFRAPWIKGLLGVFDFRKFIEINQCSPIIKDIYGLEHDLIKENIQIIFFKSQFKMAKFYDSWQDYKDYFKKYGCQAGRCKTEEDRIKKTHINYQMLQSLTDVTDEEISQLMGSSVNRLNNICTSVDTMLDILGATIYNPHPNPYQKAVKMYPSLLNDVYSKDVLRNVKDSLVKKYRSGKIDINGKYTFVLPDFYAVCEHLFMGIEQPKGLLGDGEVFCSLYKHFGKLDCLRSPHLYREHAIRKNVAFMDDYGDRTTQLSEWFTTKGIYTSTHDLISKLLMFDCDGDTLLVVADPLFVSIAERNMKDIVPLYYEMRKAAPTEINSKTLYEGLNLAFIHGNIGIYSNNISKIWNNKVFIDGTDEEKQQALDCIKLLCMENNFCIDAAKTLYMPERPKWFSDRIAKFTRVRLPAFFKYAKDKEDVQVEKRNNSFVNKIYSYIPNKRLNFNNIGLDKPNFRKMMRNPNWVCSEEIKEIYHRMSNKYHYMIDMKDEYEDNLHYVACKIRNEFSATGNSDEVITDMLVSYLYTHNIRRKQLLWFCYGQYIVNNLEYNLACDGTLKKTKYVECVDCGEWFEVGVFDSKSCRCDKCEKIHKNEYMRKLMNAKNAKNRLKK